MVILQKFTISFMNSFNNVCSLPYQHIRNSSPWFLMVGWRSSLRPLGITLSVIHFSQNNIWLLYLPTLSRNLSILKAKYSAKYSSVKSMLFVLIIAVTCTWRIYCNCWSIKTKWFMVYLLKLVKKKLTVKINEHVNCIALLWMLTNRNRNNKYK